MQLCLCVGSSHSIARKIPSFLLVISHMHPMIFESMTSHSTLFFFGGEDMPFEIEFIGCKKIPMLVVLMIE